MLSKVNRNTIFKNFNFNQNVKSLKPYLYTTYFILVIFIIIAIITYFLSRTNFYKNKIEYIHFEKFNETNEVLLKNKNININTDEKINTTTPIINRNKLYLINNQTVQIIPINKLTNDNSHIIRKEPEGSSNDYKYLSINNKGNIEYKTNEDIIKSKGGGGNFERFVRLINKSEIGNESGTIQYYTSKFEGTDDIDSNNIINRIVVNYKESDVMDVMNNQGSLENSFFKYDDENDEGKYYEYYVPKPVGDKVHELQSTIGALINDSNDRLKIINDIINDKKMEPLPVKMASNCPPYNNYDYGTAQPGCTWIYDVLGACSSVGTDWYKTRLLDIKKPIGVDKGIINKNLNIIKNLSDYVGDYKSRYKSLLNEKIGTKQAMTFQLNIPNLNRIHCGNFEKFDDINEDIIENFVTHIENMEIAENLINHISSVRWNLANITKNFYKIKDDFNKIINLLQGTKITYDNLAINYTPGNINSYENRSNKSINIQELPYKTFKSNNESEYLIFYINQLNKKLLYWQYSNTNIKLSKVYNINQKIIDDTYKFKINKTDDGGNYKINTKDNKNLLKNINIVSYTGNSDSYFVTKFINNYDKYYLMPHKGYKKGLNKDNTLLNPVDNINTDEFNKIHKFKKYDENYKIFIIEYKNPFNDYPIPSSLIINDYMEITGKRIDIYNIDIDNNNHTYSIIYESNGKTYYLIDRTNLREYTTENIPQNGRFKLNMKIASKKYQFTNYSNPNITFNYKMYDLGGNNIGLVDENDNVMFFKNDKIIDNFNGDKYNRFDLQYTNIKFKLIINDLNL